MAIQHAIQKEIGDGVILRYTCTVDGVATDPTTITARVQDPDGTVTVYVYLTNSELTKDSTGIFELAITLTKAGQWWIRFEGTGACIATTPDYIISVRDSIFIA